MPVNLACIVPAIADEITADAFAIEASADAKDDTLAPGAFGIAVVTTDGALVTGGAATTPFALQSIAKVFALECATAAIGDAVFRRVGREPSGDPFDSIVDLERTKGIPRNPFINAGALVVVDMLVEHLPDHRERGAVIDLVRRQLGDDAFSLDDGVMEAEQAAGDLNRAIMSFARHHDNLHCAIDDVMAAYVRQCAIRLDCTLLARAGLFLADTRRRPDDAAADAVAKRMRRILALMMTCGHYDGSGDFAVRVGLPAKSGVAGGILAVVPDTAAIAVWSANLDQHGNSMLGVRALEMLAERTGWSVFGPPRD